jgi:hypothetical protein
MNEPAFDHEFLVTTRETARSIERKKSAMIAERYWKAAYMSRNSSHKLQELYHFREEGDSGGMRGGRRGCRCPQQSRNTPNGVFNNAGFSVCSNQGEERKVFRRCRLSSKLEPCCLKEAKNQWVASPKARNAGAVNPLRPSIQSRGGPSHA